MTNALCHVYGLNNRYQWFVFQNVLVCKAYIAYFLSIYSQSSSFSRIVELASCVINRTQQNWKFLQGKYSCDILVLSKIILILSNTILSISLKFLKQVRIFLPRIIFLKTRQVNLRKMGYSWNKNTIRIIFSLKM